MEKQYHSLLRPSTKNLLLQVFLISVSGFLVMRVVMNFLGVFDDGEDFISEHKRSAGLGTVEKIFKGTPDNDPELVSYVKNQMLVPPSTRPYNLSKPNLVDSSQFGQTKVLDTLLHNMTHGFFVEVGAYDGEWLSNTLYFERYRNWTGLLIEATPNDFQALKTKNRKSYGINACLAITPHAAVLNFIPGGTGGRLAQGGNTGGVKIQCLPLYTLMLALGRTQIDLLSLDIEGEELKVIKSVPWDKMQIRLMMVEINHVPEGPEAVKKYMESVGYTFIKALDIDYIFAKKDLLDKAGQ